ncbi:phage portal protein [Mesorhizobium sp. L103C105A0]|uniref:phage portal protein n=1 Tax=Mesorhizobium sp. L103C105A0 TaxID=1287074 RepID=UPI0003D062BA|nr:phage portal protein [Mesorhizobium sp. L103C105A0]ESZ76297.1 portal protein [Mesorhizobium sp. L103C105A0]
MWPFKPTQPPVETKSLAEPDEELLALLGAAVAGVAAVPASVALTVPGVRNAVSVIAESAATMSLTVKRRVGDEETDVADFPALKLLTGQANSWTSGYELTRDLVAQALTQDKGGLAWVNRPSGRPAEIIRYESSVIDVHYDAVTGEPTYRLSGKVVPTSDIIHVRGAFSKCPLTQCAEAIGVAKAMEAYAAKLWTAGSKPSGVIQFPNKLGDEALKKMKAGWQAAHSGSANAGSTAILWEGATWQQITLNSTDAQYLENRQFQLAEIARAFNIPQHMIGKLDRATWSTSEQAAKEYLTFTLLPWLRALESAFNRALLSDEERGEYRFCFDLDDFTQADITARATAISTLITAKVLNSNEARDWLGLPPRTGGDVYENPNTGAKPANDNKPAKAAAA